MKRKTSPTGKSDLRLEQSSPSANGLDREPEEHETRPSAGSLARTKKLLLAALRVWELKNDRRSDGRFLINGRER